MDPSLRTPGSAAEPPSPAPVDAMATLPPLELWGGAECSVVRLQGRVENQLQRTGHAERLEDLDRLADLGLRTLRFPLLWELHPGPQIDWQWADARLDRLGELGIRPIVGLLHHGCGPLEDGFLAPDFVERLAEFAHAVASRYPWIDAYTPVNEPLTTARFSGMYDLWHPHGNCPEKFARVFLRQCQGVRAAMRALRAVNPQAQLVQTEDIGKIHSLPGLAFQADFENERRWLTFDLLMGQLPPGGALWCYLRDAGATEEELGSFREDPCPPDLFGMNYYITSERLLDHRLDHYPDEPTRGNGRDLYADVPAVRARTEGVVGPGGLIRELWARHRRPIAITEAQLACTRDEQVRWLLETWHSAGRARAEGVDLRAVTVWSLFGAYDWDSLLVSPLGHYEPGVFDVRGGRPRPTALAALTRALATGTAFQHPLLDQPGWWRRDSRYSFTPVSAPATGRNPDAAPVSPDPRPLLLVGTGGRLSRELGETCRLRGLNVRHHLGHAGDAPELADALNASGALRPWAVIDATVEAWVDREELAAAPVQPEYPGSSALAGRCHALGLPYVSVSSARVFGRPNDQPWRESDPPCPADPAGVALAEREAAIVAAHPAALVLRAGPWFAGSDAQDFMGLVLQRLESRRRVAVPAGVTVSPTHLSHLSHALLDLLIDEATGLWHVAGDGFATCEQWARAIAESAGFDPARIYESTRSDAALPSPRGPYTALASERGALLRPWPEAVAEHLRLTGRNGRCVAPLVA